MQRATKIVATIGPASDPPNVLKGVLEAGADVARLGLAHGPLSTSIDRIARVRAAAKQIGRPVGILVDLPGPKVRSAPFSADGVRLGTVDRVEGDRIKLIRADSGLAHTDHHHYISRGLFADIEGDQVRLSANADVPSKKF